MSSLFSGCSSLTDLNVSSFNTSNVTEMQFMFSSCTSLTSLDVSKFNTSNVTNMSGMFRGTSSITSLDLINFNTAKVKYMMTMFYGCKDLTTIYVDDTNWTVANVTVGSNAFTGCTNLVGGNGTAYNANRIDCNYACVDKPEEPGYLTFKSGSGIKNIEQDKFAIRRYYTLDGKLLQSEPTKSGVYVVNGRKVVKK